MALVRLFFFNQGNPQRGQTVDTHLLGVVPEAGEISNLFLNEAAQHSIQPRGRQMRKKAVGEGRG